MWCCDGQWLTHVEAGPIDDWIPAVHLVDTERQIGGSYEELLTLSPARAGDPLATAPPIDEEPR